MRPVRLLAPRRRTDAPARLLLADDVLAALAAACRKAGGQRDLAREVRVPHSPVSQTLSGKREMSTTLANALGFVAVQSFVHVLPQGGRGPPKAATAGIPPTPRPPPPALPGDPIVPNAPTPPAPGVPTRWPT